MNAYLVFLLAGVGTYAARSIFIVTVGDRPLPESVELALRNIGPAVLAALTASLLTSDGVGDYLTNLPEVAATVVAVGMSWFTKRYLLSFGSAMAVLWLLQWLT